MIKKLCELCPHRCSADRFDAMIPGFCGALNKPRVFRWGPHFGEEPPITGDRGSGCVFFSRCTMKCLYCQNSPWSWNGSGEDKSIEEFTEIFRTLVLNDKVENINLVSPTPYLPFIREAHYALKKDGIKIPYVWNSSGYERVEVLEEYRELCDWALFDLRYSSDETAIKLSAAPGYVNAARSAVKWAYEKSGVDLIVRILVLPGHHEEAIENLAFLASELSNEIKVSIMSQFTPAYKACETPPLNRSVTEEEYEEVVEAAEDFGFENGWIQGYEASDPKLALLGENMTENHGVVK